MVVRERVSAYRSRMRERGFRLMQVWVPDVHSDQFAAEAARQSRLVGRVDRGMDDQAFIESISADWDA